MTEFLAPGTIARAAPQDQTPQLAILSPAPETRVWRNPEQPPGMDRLALRAQVSPNVRQIVWLVDGEDYALADPASPLYWPLRPGAHRFQIRMPLQGRVSRAVRIVVE